MKKIYNIARVEDWNDTIPYKKGYSSDSGSIFEIIVFERRKDPKNPKVNGDFEIGSFPSHSKANAWLRKNFKRLTEKDFDNITSQKIYSDYDQYFKKTK